MAGTLLLLHGVGSDGTVWDRAKALFEGADWAVSAPTLFPELRTTAEPPEALAALTLEDYLAEARRHAQKIASQEGRPPIVIGHSMGGLLAQHLVVSGDVRAGVFVTPAAPAGCEVIALRPVRSFWGIGRAGLQKLEGRSWKLSRDGAEFIMSKRIPASHRAAICNGSLSHLADATRRCPSRDPTMLDPLLWSRREPHPKRRIIESPSISIRRCHVRRPGLRHVRLHAGGSRRQRSAAPGTTAGDPAPGPRRPCARRRRPNHRRGFRPHR